MAIKLSEREQFQNKKSGTNNNSLKRGFDDGNGEVNKLTGFNQKTQK